jgi:hypothetical protein
MAKRLSIRNPGRKELLRRLKKSRPVSAEELQRSMAEARNREVFEQFAAAATRAGFNRNQAALMFTWFATKDHEHRGWRV